MSKGLIGMSNLGTKDLFGLVVGMPNDTFVLHKWTQLRDINLPSSVRIA